MNTAHRSLEVRVGSPAHAVSPDLWGVFFEDINYAADGGLNADLVQNGDFGYGPQDAEGWHALTAWRAEPEGAVRCHDRDPVATDNPVHVSLDAGARLTNEGWNGIPVQPDRDYLARFALRGDGLVTVSLDDAAEATPLASGSVRAGSEWSWHAVRLRSPRDARTHLSFTADAAVHLDGVSLHPCDAATGEPELFRADLLEAISALHPSFVRFPGGCLVHGIGLDNLYHWKRTLGPRLERAAMRNLWGYRQSMAIGYYEYFLLCERLGAAALPVVAAGVSCQNTPGGIQCIAEEDMPAYVQDVLDLVEFATGDVDTQWGARRAALGHAEPFGLRYLGVGNEDEITDQFARRYEMIDRAVRERHPGVEVIGTAGPIPAGADFDAGWKLARELDVDIVDEHMYRSPRWFLQSVGRYDDYPRTGPAVYVGEWAARSNRLRSAVAEAAFMIGMERNSDIVRLASYAPLLAKVDHTQWTPDLIYFDDEHVLPTVNYHVQAAFGRDRIARWCPVELDAPEVTAQPLPSMRRVRAALSGDQAQLVSLRVDGRELPAPALGADGAVLLEQVPAGTRELVLTLHSSDGVKIEFGADPDDTFHELWLGVKPNRAHLWRTDDAIACHLEGTDIAGLDPAHPVEVVIRLDDARIRVELEGRAIFDADDEVGSFPAVVVGAGTTEAGGWSVRAANASAEPRTTTVRFDGHDGDLRGRAEVIGGEAPDTGEQFVAYPHPPRHTQLAGRDGVVELTLPAWSVVVADILPS